VDSIAESDLDALVANQVPESTTLEYKVQLPDNRSEADKAEFLKDVTALANRDGGVILYGVATKQDGSGDTGIPETIKGVELSNEDALYREWEQRLGSSVSPPLRSEVLIRATRLSNGKAVVAVGVSRGFGGPHRVETQKLKRFYRRGGTTIYEPSVQELRQMFLATAAWRSDAETFRERRIARHLQPAISSGYVMVRMSGPPRAQNTSLSNAAPSLVIQTDC